MRTNVAVATVVAGTAIMGAVLSLAPEPQTKRLAELEPVTLELDAMLAEAANAVYALDQVVAADSLYLSRADDVAALFGELVEASPSGGTIRLHAAPIRFRDDRGTLRAINTTLAAYEMYGVDVLINETNTVKTAIYPDGAVSMTTQDGDTFAWTPVSVDWLVDGSEQIVVSGAAKVKPEKPVKAKPIKLRSDNIRDVGRGKIKCCQERPEKAVVRDLFSDGVELHNTVVPGGIKQDFIIPTKLSHPKGATHIAFTSQWKAPGCEMAIEGETLVVARDGEAVFRVPPMPVVDARGERVSTSYTLDGDTFGVLVPADYLDKAKYPVTVDPTATSNVYVAATWTTDSPSQTEDTGAYFVRMNLPDITGTVTDATWTLTKTSSVAASDTLSIYSFAIHNTAWTESTPAGTLNALVPTTDHRTWTTNVNPLDSIGAQYEWGVAFDVYDASTGLIPLYESSCSPSVTLCLWVGAQVDENYDGGGDVDFYWNSTADLVTLAGYDYVTEAYRPTLEITYSGYLGCQADTGPSYWIGGL